MIHVRPAICAATASILLVSCGPKDEGRSKAAPPAASQGVITLGTATDGATGTLTITVCDADLDRDRFAVETVGVTVRSPVETDGEVVTLTETGASTGTFVGTLALRAASTPVAGDETLEVGPGDTIVATYTDADDGTGQAVAVDATAIPVPLPPPPAPDLHAFSTIGEIIPAESPTYLFVSEQIRNETLVAAPPSTSRIFLSADPVLDPGDLAIAEQPAGGVPPSGVHNYYTYVALSELPPGDFYVIAVVDTDDAIAETSEANNVRASPIPVTIPANVPPPPAPDLVESWVTAEATPAGGAVVKDSVAASATGGYSSIFVARYYLSPDATLGNGDDVLVGERWLGVNPGYAFPGTIQVAAGAVAPGSYYAFAVADAGGWIVESDETNNVAMSAAPVVIGPPPDLSPALVAGDVAPATSPSQLVVTERIRAECSGGAAPTSTSRIFLSADAVLDAGDLVIAEHPVAALAACGVADYTTPVALSALPAGDFYLIALADADDVILESSEANNALASSTPVTIPAVPPPAPDLYANFTFVEIGPAPSASYLCVSEQIRNETLVAAPPSTSRIFLSADPVLDPGDLAIAEQPVGGIPPWGVYNYYTYVALSELPPGDFYAIAVLDADDAITETSETNNVRASPIPVTIPANVPPPPAPDLIESWVTAEATPAGGAVVKDSVAASAAGGYASIFVARYYLSPDATLGNGDDVLVGERWLGVNPGYAFPGTIQVAAGAVAPGSYYAFAVADAGGWIVESDETNNVAMSAAPVVIPARP